MGRVKVNLRKERDKDGYSRSLFPNLFQIIIQTILVMACTASHLPVTSDLGSKVNLTQNELGVTNMLTPSVHRSSLPNAPSRNFPVFNATCTDQVMTVIGSFPEAFKGRIYASDYSDESECGVVLSRDPSENVTLLLGLGQCGIQMTALDNNVDSPELLHEVSLYVQYSAFLQQMSDERVTVFCVEVRRPATEELNEKGDSSEGISKRGSRQGRRMKDASRSVGLQKTNTKIGEAIMEIIGGKDPSPKSKKVSPVTVGEDVTLVISTKVIRGFDARIVNCTTHDGSRSASGSEGIRNQPILDSAGCSVDKSLVPNFRRRRLPVEARNRFITLHFASFAAFKFPDRDHLHIQCTVAYCQGPCPQEPCDSDINHYGTWRDKYGRIADVLMDTSTVVNSIEVLSPDLDSPGGHHYERHQSSSAVGTPSVTTPNNAENHQTSPPSAATSSQRPPTHYSKTPANYQPHQYYSPQGMEHSYSIQNARHKSLPAIEPPPSTASNLTQYNVCISPGTVIIALVALGLVIVISITTTLWFALKRSEVRKYAESHKSAFSSPGPSPYYRFNPW